MEGKFDDGQERWDVMESDEILVMVICVYVCVQVCVKGTERSEGDDHPRRIVNTKKETLDEEKDTDGQ